MAKRKGKKKRAARRKNRTVLDGPKISLCMIVRDEEKHLQRCIRSVRAVVDEIIVVDTGSTDGTVGIARTLDARIFHYQWNDDFSEARNYSIEQASGDWILVLDADEQIADRDSGRIRALAAGDASGYTFTYRSYSQQSDDIRWVANDGSYAEGEGWDGWISGDVVRLFRRDPRIRFVGAVHESVDPAISSIGGTVRRSDIIIHHFHEEKGQERLREKQLHYLRLCERNLKNFPGVPKTHFDMGLIYRHVLGDNRKAIFHQTQALRLNPDYEDARMALALSYNLEGDTPSAAREIATLLARNPRSAPALTLCGIILERQGKIERAIECYERALELNPNLIDARINLGMLWLKKGGITRARNEWEQVLQLNPSNVRALLNLGALELRDGKHLAAQSLFEKALERSPENAMIWNNLGVLHAGLGRAQEAVGAFEKAVELDPSSTDARRNLETIRGNVKSAV